MPGRSHPLFDPLLHDLRHALRGLRQNPAFTLTAVFSLALGIGANVAIFSIVRAMLLAPLPYRGSDRLVFVWLDRSDVKYPRAPLSSPDLRDLREGSRTCAAFGGIWASSTVALTGDGHPEQLRAAIVTPNFFDVLGAEPALGRTFRPEDSANGAAPTILLGWDLFTRRYGGDRTIVGRQIVVNDESTTVIGVMPQDFRLLLPPDSAVPDHLQVWQPMPQDFAMWPRGSLYLRVIGRLRPEATLAEARADIAAIAHRISAETGGRRAFSVVALQADDVREIRAPLVALLAGVAILLAIACVNVASLLTARAVARARDTAVRLALGASRGRLAAHAMMEGLVLTLLGAAAGLWVGYLGLQLLLARVPESLSRLSAARIDGPVLGFTLAIAVAWGVLFSLAPLAELLKVDAVASLQRRFAALGRYASPAAYRTRALLVVLQIALSVVLLVGAGLLMRSFTRVRQVDVGYETGRHLTFRVALPESRYRSRDAVLNAAADLQQRLAAVPGVESAGAISHLPFDDLPNWGLTYALDALPQKGGAPFTNARCVTPGLLETLGAKLVEGRFFNEDDRSPEHLVVIVDHVLAQRLWPGRRAVGQQFMLGQGEPTRRAEVVGVVSHLKTRSLLGDLGPHVFLPYRIWPRSPMAFVIRGATDPGALAGGVRAAVAGFDPQLPIYDVRPLQGYVDAARATRKFTMLLAGAFALSALVLTWIGVYGVLAYAVSHRRQEFAVRRALGADGARVIRHVLREGLRFAIAGGVIGMAGAIVGARLLAGQLYGVHPHDPATYAAAFLLILAGALIACWIPARRAVSISPMEALRCE